MANFIILQSTLIEYNKNIEDEELQEGRAAHQGPEVDGTISFIGTDFKVGEYIDAVIVDSMGADLVAEASR